MTKFILRTPLIDSDICAKNKIFLKAENLQTFGSYKIRGVLSAIHAAPSEKLKNGLFAASAGNMAQAVAFVAGMLNIPCRIFVPLSAPEIKKNAIKQLNAKLVELPFEDVWKMVQQPSETEGLFIHPVLTNGLLHGYGQIGLEILEDLPEADAIVIPFGVGGLSLGLARHLKKQRPDIKIFCCEPETACPLATSLQNGFASSIERKTSFIDAIGTPEVLPYVFADILDLIEDSIVVSILDTEIAIEQLVNKNKLICEGAAGVAYAAAKKIQKIHGFKNIVAILSGGNISPTILHDILTKIK